MTIPTLRRLPVLLTALYAGSILLANLTLNQFIPLTSLGLLRVATGLLGVAAIVTLLNSARQARTVGLVYLALAGTLLVLSLNQSMPPTVVGLLSVGTIFFAAVFTLRDRIHRAGGLKAVYIAIAVALIVNTLAALLTGTPWRFIGASFLAILVGELADTTVYQSLIQRSWWTRVLTSNAVSVPLDSIIFTLLAFWGDKSNAEIGQIIFADILAKYAIAAVFALRVRDISRRAVAS